MGNLRVRVTSPIPEHIIKERERGRANYSLFRFFRHDHVPPSLRIPVRRGRRGCLRDHQLRDRALGLVVLRMPSADDRRPPSSPSFSVDDGVISPPHHDICDDNDGDDDDDGSGGGVVVGNTTIK